MLLLFKSDRWILQALQEFINRLSRIEEGIKHMATKQDFDTLLAAVNEATNAIAARIDALIAKLAAGGMTADEEASVQAELQAASDRLKALGQDPENPVPTP